MLSGNDPTFDPFQFAPLQLSGQADFSRLETLIMQMLKMSKDERPASMAAIKQELFSISIQRMSGQTGAEPPTQASAFTTTVKSPPGTSTSQKTNKRWLDEGNALYEAKHYKEALTAYDQAIQLNPQDAYTYNNRGNTLYNFQCYQEALMAHERAILLDPTLADAYNNKGNALYNLKRYQEALVAYDCAIQLDATDAFAHYNKGIALKRLGGKKEAKQAQERAWQLGYREW